MTGQTIMIRTTLPVAHVFIKCTPFASSIHDAGAGYPTTMTCTAEEFVKGCARIGYASLRRPDGQGCNRCATPSEEGALEHRERRKHDGNEAPMAKKRH